MTFWLGGGGGDGGGALQAEEEPSLLPQVESGDCILENSLIPSPYHHHTIPSFVDIKSYMSEILFTCLKMSEILSEIVRNR